MVTKRMATFAKELRSRSTDAERSLWRHLRAKRMAGFKFRRQHPMGVYIADFICPEKRLVIELDGGQHSEPSRKKYDDKRDAWLKRQGYMVLRFWDNDVLSRSGEVLEVIRKHCVEHPPLKGGEVTWLHHHNRVSPWVNVTRTEAEAFRRSRSSETCSPVKYMGCRGYL